MTTTTTATREDLDARLDRADLDLDRAVGILDQLERANPGGSETVQAQQRLVSRFRQRIGDLRAELRTICEVCGRSGADDHHDHEGIYAGRWHEACEGPSQRARRNYRWSPGDEPLDEE